MSIPFAAITGLKAEKDPLRVIDLALTVGTTLYEPKMAGLVFPYFQGLLTPDKESVLATFTRYFTRCLGDTAKKAADLLVSLRDGFRNISMSQGGLILQHVYFGLQIAATTGSRFTIIAEGSRYLGFVVESPDIIVFQQATIHTPLSRVELSKEIRELSVHDRSLGKLATLLSDMFDVNSEIKTPVLKEALGSSRAVAMAIYQKDFSSLEQMKKDVAACLDLLTFGDTYWTITGENMVRLMNAIASGRWEFPNAPFYLGGDVPFTTDPILRALAVFGPQAPSIYHGDTIRSIPLEGKSDRNLEVNATSGKRDLRYIPVFSRAIKTAAGEWATVVSRSSIKYYAPRKGKNEFANQKPTCCLIEGDQFTPFYNQLKRYLTSVHGARTEEDAATKKRKADAEIEAGVRKKKVRVEITSIADEI